MYLSSSSSRTNTRCKASSRKRCGKAASRLPSCPRGEEALTLFRGKVAPYRVLVADVNLKGALSGWEVARQPQEQVAEPEPSPAIPHPAILVVAGPDRRRIERRGRRRRPRQRRAANAS
jgi:hypothetical protein